MTATTHPGQRRPPRDAGFTLLELLVVLGILALLAAFVGPSVLRYMGKARTDTARAQIAAIGTAIEMYALDMGQPPATETGLGALVTPPQGAQRWRGPYLKSANGLVDPWGRPYHYRAPGKTAPYEIFTYGQDNAPSGTGEDQDIVSW
jgi:general secretion pathway protein G